MDDTKWSCSLCRFELYLPVPAPALSECVLGLYSDSRFPGRSIVVFRRHVEHLEALSASELASLWTDVAAVGRAVKAATNARRINYAVLGNATPHLHVHVIPRDPSTEELPTRPPWNDPRPLGELTSQQLTVLTAALEHQLR